MGQIDEQKKHKQILLEIFDEDFWKSFLKNFVDKIISPVEFAFTNKNGKGSQREWALSAAVQRAFIFEASHTESELKYWKPALEVPYINNNHGTNYIDVVLYPWHQSPVSIDTYSPLKNIEKCVSIELKWYDLHSKYFQVETNTINSSVEEDVNEIHSNPDIVLFFIFHGRKEPKINLKREDFNFQKYKIVQFVGPVDRDKVIKFGRNYTQMSLLILMQGQ